MMDTKTNNTYEHYKMVHEAVQSCHSYSWQLTAIYVPAIGAGIYMLARGEAGAFLSIVMGVLLIGLTLYWYFNQVALDRFNDARYELLEKLEKELFTGDCEWMAYYSALARRKKSWYAEFKVLRILILIVYVLAIGLVVWANVSSKKPERERREISAAAMDLWTLQTPNYDLTSGRVDHSQSVYYNTVSNVKEAYRKLWQRLKT